MIVLMPHSCCSTISVSVRDSARRTAGLVVAVTALLQRNPDADTKTVKDALAPNICRCGSHPRVLRAVEEAKA